ncbi:hypothetical protein KCP73_08565 [Salmonella enterica subsp. enterica]|nr:hypothetical protein KCP73_08565 [Salmonella enterica subsp. enterica]
MVNAKVTQRGTEKYRVISPAGNSSSSNSLDAPLHRLNLHRRRHQIIQPLTMRTS